MKKVTKIFIVIIVSLALLLIACFSYNCVQTSNELETLDPLGITVPVGNGKMSIYTEGNGNKTLVFLSGGGTCSPILDFKSLYKTLSDTYKIVVVEKFGYGYSDIIPRSRDIDVILSDTREALHEAHINGPFILVPHSASGLEALYWAQNYPNEVEAIIGLDMATPYHYEKIDFSIPLLYIGRELHLIGFTRFIPGIWKGDAVKYGTLTEEEKQLYKAIFFSRTATRNMMDEIKSVKHNAQKVSLRSYPHIPILLIISNGKGTGIKTDEWRLCSKQFKESCDDCEIIEYDAPHYIHDYKYNEISEDIDNFIEIL